MEISLNLLRKLKSKIVCQIIKDEEFVENLIRIDLSKKKKNEYKMIDLDINTITNY